MKNFILEQVLILPISLISISNCTKNVTKAQRYNFRKTNWGMSQEQVRYLDEIVDKGTDRSGNTYLVARDTIISLPSRAMYYFSLDGELIGGGYIFEISHPGQKNEFIYDFNRLQRYLTNKYGSPNKERVLWKDEQAQKSYNSDHWGQAISDGVLTLYARWQNTETTIELFLQGNEGEMSPIILYKSKESTSK